MSFEPPQVSSAHISPFVVSLSKHERSKRVFQQPPTLCGGADDPLLASTVLQTLCFSS